MHIVTDWEIYSGYEKKGSILFITLHIMLSKDVQLLLYLYFMSLKLLFFIFFLNIILSKGCMCSKWLYVIFEIERCVAYRIYFCRSFSDEKCFVANKTVKFPKLLCSALWWTIKWMVNKQQKQNTKLNEYFKQKVLAWSMVIVYTI